MINELVANVENMIERKLQHNQRRYEIAKDCLAAYIIVSHTVPQGWCTDEDLARYSVRNADLLLAELEKTEVKSED